MLLKQKFIIFFYFFPLGVSTIGTIINKKKYPSSLSKKTDNGTNLSVTRIWSNSLSQLKYQKKYFYDIIIGKKNVTFPFQFQAGIKMATKIYKTVYVIDLSRDRLAEPEVVK